MSLEHTLHAMLEEATSMRDDAAARTIRAVLADVESPLDDDAVARVVRTEIDERARLASRLAAVSPEEAAMVRREAEVLTIALARAGH